MEAGASVTAAAARAWTLKIVPLGSAGIGQLYPRSELALPQSAISTPPLRAALRIS